MYGACMVLCTVHVWCIYNLWETSRTNSWLLYGACMVHVRCIHDQDYIKRRTTIHPFPTDCSSNRLNPLCIIKFVLYCSVFINRCLTIFMFVLFRFFVFIVCILCIFTDNYVHNRQCKTFNLTTLPTLLHPVLAVLTLFAYVPKCFPRRRYFIYCLKNFWSG